MYTKQLKFNTAARQEYKSGVQQHVRAAADTAGPTRRQGSARSSAHGPRPPHGRGAAGFAASTSRHWLGMNAGES